MPLLVLLCFYEPHYCLLGIGRCVGQGEEQILVPTTLLQALQQWIDGEFLTPIFTVKKNHRTFIAECTVVVLRGILKHLLQRAGTAGRVDYTTLCNGQQAIFAYTVVEILCYMGCKRSCRLVSIESGRDTNAATLAHAWHLLHKGKCR